jgi:hypothetical protein
MDKLEMEKKFGSSVMEDMIAISTGFELSRRVARKSGDKWTQEIPIDRNMKTRIDGYLVMTPARPNEIWLQYEDDMPETTLAVFKLKQSAGELQISQTYPHRDLWNDYVTFCDAAFERGDAATGACDALPYLHYSSYCAQVTCGPCLVLCGLPLKDSRIKLRSC